MEGSVPSSHSLQHQKCNSDVSESDRSHNIPMLRRYCCRPVHASTLAALKQKAYTLNPKTSTLLEAPMLTSAWPGQKG